MEPIDSADPTDPIDRTDPTDPIDRIEPCDARDHRLRGGAPIRAVCHRPATTRYRIRNRVARVPGPSPALFTARTRIQ